MQNYLDHNVSATLHIIEFSHIVREDSNGVNRSNLDLKSKI